MTYVTFMLNWKIKLKIFPFLFKKYSDFFFLQAKLSEWSRLRHRISNHLRWQNTPEQEPDRSSVSTTSFSSSAEHLCLLSSSGLSSPSQTPQTSPSPPTKPTTPPNALVESICGTIQPTRFSTTTRIYPTQSKNRLRAGTRSESGG